MFCPVCAKRVSPNELQCPKCFTSFAGGEWRPVEGAAGFHRQPGPKKVTAVVLMASSSTYFFAVLVAIAQLQSIDANLWWLVLLATPLLAIAFPSSAALLIAASIFVIGVVLWLKQPMVKKT
jgi:hypothetical protein